MPRVHRTFPINRFEFTLKSGRNALLIGLLPLMLLTSSAYAEGISKIDIIVSTCFTCHGVDGVGSGKIPELRDLKKSDITESLLGFASGDESSTIMGRHAKAYTKEEINQLAEYFAKFKK
jgi:sulfide dehydrogenase cytochrome subunit